MEGQIDPNVVFVFQNRLRHGLRLRLRVRLCSLVSLTTRLAGGHSQPEPGDVPVPVAEWSTLIGPDQSRYCFLIG